MKNPQLDSLVHWKKHRKIIIQFRDVTRFSVERLERIVFNYRLKGSLGCKVSPLQKELMEWAEMELICRRYDLPTFKQRLIMFYESEGYVINPESKSKILS